jgi:hypothetical protein
MRLKSFGCSFMFGSDLQDPARSTWPSLIAQRMGWAYECYASGGSGNLRIAESVLNQLSVTRPQTSLFVIGWTWIDRFDYTNEQDQWLTLLPAHTDHVSKRYYRDLHSQYRDKLTSLINIKLVIDQLKATNTKFVMTYMDDLLFDDQWHVNQAIRDLQASIRPYMTTFDKKTFLEWSKSSGFAISQELHPLEQAHASAADYVITNVFDIQSTSDPAQLALF